MRARICKYGIATHHQKDWEGRQVEGHVDLYVDSRPNIQVPKFAFLELSDGIVTADPSARRSRPRGWLIGMSFEIVKHGVQSRRLPRRCMEAAESLREGKTSMGGVIDLLQSMENV